MVEIANVKKVNNVLQKNKNISTKNYAMLTEKKHISQMDVRGNFE